MSSREEQDVLAQPLAVPVRHTARMRSPIQWFADLDGDWRAVVVGLLGAPTLFGTGLVIGAVEGGLLPGACEGLTCLYFGVLVGYSLLLLAGWGVLAGITALARRFASRSRLRLRVLQVVAAASYLPVLWLVGQAALDWL